ncbi:MAG: NAD(P)-dependent oxidoreductase [Patescibacteria group bacterium]
MKKAVFIDHKDGELSDKVFKRIAKNFDETEFVMSDDKNKIDKVKDADAVFVKIFSKIDKQVIDAAKNLKYIGVCSTAFDAIDAKYAREKGISVCNLGGYSTEAVAEFFFATLMEQTRELERARIQARKSDFGFRDFMGLELKEKTLGVIGAGEIGSRVAQIGLGFGMKVLYFSRKNKREIEKIGAKKVELDEVLSKSDFLSLNLVLNSETKNIISEEKIALIKQDSVFINLSPPHLIDEHAMMAAAKAGKLTFIFDHSDDTEFAKEFLATPNCITYPPVAFRTKQADKNRWEAFAGGIEKFIAGEPINVVN